MKPYEITVQYDIAMLDGDPLEQYLYADSYLIKLMKDRSDVVFVGQEMGLAPNDEGVIERLLFFKTDSFEAALAVMETFSENDKDFTKSYMDTEDDTSLELSYEEIEDPIRDDEREYSKEKMAEDPRAFLEFLEHGIIEEDDDDEDEDVGPNA